MWRVTGPFERRISTQGTCVVLERFLRFYECLAMGQERPDVLHRF